MSYTLLSSRTSKAVKQHKCIWCGESILVGEKYNRSSSIFDGDFQDQCWHLECLEDAQKCFKEEHSCEFSAYDNERPKKQLGLCQHTTQQQIGVTTWQAAIVEWCPECGAYRKVMINWKYESSECCTDLFDNL